MSKTGTIIFWAAVVIVVGSIGWNVYVRLDHHKAPTPHSILNSLAAINITNPTSSSPYQSSSKPLSEITTIELAPTSSVAVTPAAATTTTIAPPADNDPPTLTINPQTIVGILCYYNALYTDDGQTFMVPDYEEVRGSGVIINSKGYILTNRHIVEQPDSQDDTVGTVSYQLDHCEVGQIPAGDTLPTAQQIESTNPYVQLPVLGYTAQPIYISQPVGMSDVEVEYADFAVLQITGVSSSGPTFGITSVPHSFPYATLLPTKFHADIVNDQVLTYGFPGDVTSGQGNFFGTLTMTGSVGSVTSIEYGDQLYANTPLVVNTNLAIAHGRSGSPLFWHGYVVGLVTFFAQGNDTDSGSVASDAILQSLSGTGYIPND